MLRILFVCHGNICRSPAAEMIMRQLVKEAGLTREIMVASAAMTSEELGHDIYPPMRRALTARGVPCEAHAARRVRAAEYRQWDHLIGMDEENMWDMRRLFDGDSGKRCSLLLDWAGMEGREIEDPWYTRRFDAVLDQIQTGCEGLLKALREGLA